MSETIVGCPDAVAESFGNCKVFREDGGGRGPKADPGVFVPTGGEGPWGILTAPLEVDEGVVFEIGSVVCLGLYF